MSEILPCGIPTISEYNKLMQSEKFAELENFSSRFLDQHEAILRSYAEKWVSDPFHQWSRQWEYPFVLDQISDYCQTSGNNNVRILDAGSGLTFFPYILKEYFAGASIDCCDYDPGLLKLHESIARTENNAPQFQHAALDNSSYADDTFDCIYCISVMEHTDNYADIVAEFHRIIKPGGRLIITFDISIDGCGDIAPPKAKHLCAVLNTKFQDVYPVDTNFPSQIDREDIVTTLYAADLNLQLLPWNRKPKWTRQLESLLRHGRLISWPPPFTFCCLSLQG